MGDRAGAGAGAGAMQSFILEPGDILGNNQYKMHWVGAMIRVINLDSVLFDKIKTRENVKTYRRRKQSAVGGKLKPMWRQNHLRKVGSSCCW